MSFIGGSGKPSDYAETTVMPYYATYQEKETTVPSRRWYSVDTPAGPTTYSAGSVIRINIPGTAYLDPKNSFLKYAIKITEPDLPSGETGLDPANKVYSIKEHLLRSYHWAAHKHFRRARLLSSSGVVLEDLDLYNIHESINRKFRGPTGPESTIQDALAHADMDDMDSTGDHFNEFCNATGFGCAPEDPITNGNLAYGKIGADSVKAFVATDPEYMFASTSNIKGLDYVYQLGFGLFRSGKLLPMQYMGGLVVELTVEDDNLLVKQDSFRLGAINSVVADAVTNAWKTAKIQLSNIEFHSSLLRFDERYDLGIAEALQQTGLRIPFKSYSVVRNVMKPQGQYTLTVSERASSIIGVYGIFRPISAVNNTYRKMDGLALWPRLDLTDYQLHTATQNYPDNPVRLNATASEAFAETIKCFQGLDRAWERDLSSGNVGVSKQINSTTYGAINPRADAPAANITSYAIADVAAPLPYIRYPYKSATAADSYLHRSTAAFGEVPGFLNSTGGEGHQFVFGINTTVHPDVSSGVNTAAMAMNMDLKLSFSSRGYVINTNWDASGNLRVENDFEIDLFVESERTLEILCGGSPRVIL
jgi:hypothetical protein